MNRKVIVSPPVEKRPPSVNLVTFRSNLGLIGAIPEDLREEEPPEEEDPRQLLEDCCCFHDDHCWAADSVGNLDGDRNANLIENRSNSAASTVHSLDCELCRSEFGGRFQVPGQFTANIGGDQELSGSSTSAWSGLLLIPSGGGHQEKRPEGSSPDPGGFWCRTVPKPKDHLAKMAGRNSPSSGTTPDKDVTVIQVSGEDDDPAEEVPQLPENLEKAKILNNSGYENAAFDNSHETGCSGSQGASGSRGSSSSATHSIGSSPEPPLELKVVVAAEDDDENDHQGSMAMVKAAAPKNDDDPSEVAKVAGDDYLVSLNEHHRTGRKSQKLYVTKNCRPSSVNRKPCKKFACGSAGLVVVGVAIILAVLIGVGILDPYPKENPVMGVKGGRSRDIGQSEDSDLLWSQPRLQEVVENGVALDTRPKAEVLLDTELTNQKYVPDVFDGEFRITNLAWSPRLLDKQSTMYQELTARLTEGMVDMMVPAHLMDKATFYATIVGFAPGSVVVQYRLSWTEYQRIKGSPMRLDQEDIKENFKGALKVRNGRLFGLYNIDEASIDIQPLIDICPTMKCGGLCAYNHPENDFSCKCPDNFYLNSDDRSCVMMDTELETEEVRPTGLDLQPLPNQDGEEGYKASTSTTTTKAIQEDVVSKSEPISLQDSTEDFTSASWSGPWPEVTEAVVVQPAKGEEDGESKDEETVSEASNLVLLGGQDLLTETEARFSLEDSNGEETGVGIKVTTLAPHPVTESLTEIIEEASRSSLTTSTSIDAIPEDQTTPAPEVQTSTETIIRATTAAAAEVVEFDQEKVPVIKETTTISLPLESLESNDLSGTDKDTVSSGNIEPAFVPTEQEETTEVVFETFEEVPGTERVPEAYSADGISDQEDSEAEVATEAAEEVIKNEPAAEDRSITEMPTELADASEEPEVDPEETTEALQIEKQDTINSNLEMPGTAAGVEDTSKEEILKGVPGTEDPVQAHEESTESVETKEAIDPLRPTEIPNVFEVQVIDTKTTEANLLNEEAGDVKETKVTSEDKPEAELKIFELQPTLEVSEATTEAKREEITTVIPLEESPNEVTKDDLEPNAAVDTTPENILEDHGKEIQPREDTEEEPTEAIEARQEDSDSLASDLHVADPIYLQETNKEQSANATEASSPDQVTEAAEVQPISSITEADTESITKPSTLSNITISEVTVKGLTDEDQNVVTVNVTVPVVSDDMDSRTLESTLREVMLNVTHQLEKLEEGSSSGCGDPATEFQCQNGKCVDRYSRCDGISDCSDSSDELNCENHRCNDQDFVCPAGGTCLDPSKRCDGHIDCPLAGDELNCTQECQDKSSVFTCLADGMCVDLRFRCNGVVDCPSGEDEADCQCPQEFRCRMGGGCLASGQVCDGRPDCPDGGSDEWDCLRLVDQGLLQAKISEGNWAPICSTQWTTLMSRTACEQLGFDTLVEEDLARLADPSLSYLHVNVSSDQSEAPDSLQHIRKLSQGSEACSAGVGLKCGSHECGTWELPDGLEVQTSQGGGNQSLARHENPGDPGAEIQVDHSRAGQQWPSVAYLVHVTEKSSCTATILNSKWLLSTYACVAETDANPDQWVAFGGSSQEVPSSVQVQAQIKMVQRVVPHPAARKEHGVWRHNFALVQLIDPLVFDRNVKPVCLADGPPSHGQSCVVAGWSDPVKEGSNFHQYIGVIANPYVAPEGCNSTDHYNGRIQDDMFCSGRSLRTGPCKADSGAPLMCLDESGPKGAAWKVHGLLTAEGDCEGSGHPDIYSSVSHVGGWIRAVIGNTVQEEPEASKAAI